MPPINAAISTSEPSDVTRTSHAGGSIPRRAPPAEASVSNPLEKEKLTIPEGERDAVDDLWAAPDGRADMHVWLANPGRYDVDGADRPNFFEVTSIMAGTCTVEEPGRAPVDLRPGDTYVMQPGWTGTWVVTEYVEKCFVWVYTG